MSVGSYNYPSEWLPVMATKPERWINWESIKDLELKGHIRDREFDPSTQSSRLET